MERILGTKQGIFLKAEESLDRVGTSQDPHKGERFIATTILIQTIFKILYHGKQRPTGQCCLGKIMQNTHTSKYHISPNSINRLSFVTET
jgi:hypothetical protein